jgi:hypothetical protein
MQRFAAIIAFASCLCGCATEAERYEWNLTHIFVCPRARWLTHSDLDQIARVIAHATPQVAVTIGPPANDDSRRILLVDTVYRGADYSEDRNSYGWCKLEKSGSTWRVVERYTEGDPALTHVSRCP